MRYGLAINTKNCIGCHTCSVKCKIENNTPNGVWWNQTTTVGGGGMDCGEGLWPDTRLVYETIQCMHCENPACVEVCPTGASHKDEETGAVLVDTEQCIGCKSCMSACPYTGVRTYIEEDPQYHLDFSLGQAGMAHLKGTVEKCTLCHHRTSQGIEPACVEVCVHDARVWGDLDDPESDISKLIASEPYEQLLAERGTNPQVYYLL